MTRTELIFRIKDVLERSGVDDRDVLLRQLEIHTDAGKIVPYREVYMHLELGLVSGPSPKIYVGEARTYPREDGTVEVVTQRQSHYPIPLPTPDEGGLPLPNVGGYSVARFKVNR